jgi:hypothetical protein
VLHARLAAASRLIKIAQVLIGVLQVMTSRFLWRQFPEGTR